MYHIDTIGEWISQFSRKREVKKFLKTAYRIRVTPGRKEGEKLLEDFSRINKNLPEKMRFEMRNNLEAWIIAVLLVSGISSKSLVKHGS